MSGKHNTHLDVGGWWVLSACPSVTFVCLHRTGKILNSSSRKREAKWKSHMPSLGKNIPPVNPCKCCRRFFLCFVYCPQQLRQKENLNSCLFPQAAEKITSTVFLISLNKEKQTSLPHYSLIPQNSCKKYHNQIFAYPWKREKTVTFLLASQRWGKETLLLVSPNNSAKEQPCHIFCLVL